MFRNLLERLLVPPLCPACGKHGGEGRVICSRCRLILDSEPPVPCRPPTGIVALATAYRHEGVARNLLNSFKFGSGASLAPVLAALMLERCDLDRGCGTLVPVPPSSFGLARRGFDTADLLAGELARAIPGLGTAPGLLRRQSGRRQLGRSREERLAGVGDIVAIGDLPGPLLLVDDVMTTGATLRSSARALRRAGADTVRAITFTRRP